MDVTSATITYIGRNITSGLDVFNVTWSAGTGNFDFKYNTVQLLQNNTVIQSTIVFGDNVQISVSGFSIDDLVIAKITTTSACNQTSNGAFAGIIVTATGSSVVDEG